MRMRWLAKILLPLAEKYAARRSPDFEVIRDEDKMVYLQRWWIIRRNNWWNIYLHHMLASDDPILHDHMYASLSIMLGDGLSEVYCEDPHGMHVATVVEGGDERWDLFKKSRVIPQGSIIYRSSKFAHQLVVNRPTWTIFMTGPRIKPWGFWCPRGWRLWSDYVAIGQDPSKQSGSTTVSGRGRGCGEMS